MPKITTAGRGFLRSYLLKNSMLSGYFWANFFSDSVLLW